MTEWGNEPSPWHGCAAMTLALAGLMNVNELGLNMALRRVFIFYLVLPDCDKMMYI